MAEMMENQFIISLQLYVGEFGQKYFDDFTEILGMPLVQFNCLEGDNIFLIAHALEKSLIHGLDFEDSDKLNSAIRDTRFLDALETLCLRSTQMTDEGLDSRCNK
ncbi:MAG: hypothetical protein V2I33_22825 [Kangiellaceae bacterium]|jgi:hypothetical protein|nr:hypothetical protein [Kangiellaceae bacterium]